MNPVVWHFETDLEYLTTIPIQYFDLLTNVTKTRTHKLHPSELIMDVRFGRSTFNHFKPFHYYFALSTNMNHHSIFLTYSAASDITIHTLLSIDSIYYHSNIHKWMDHWLLNRNCLILCFHWFHLFCWQGIWLSIVIVWNQWMNGRGERELKQQQQ